MELDFKDYNNKPVILHFKDGEMVGFFQARDEKCVLYQSRRKNSEGWTLYNEIDAFDKSEIIKTVELFDFSESADSIGADEESLVREGEILGTPLDVDKMMSEIHERCLSAQEILDEVTRDSSYDDEVTQNE